ncbi:hypothetical protein D3875_01065 [Deinococcus cavernae]|uniref:SF3 helicase domain-containing protein n=1 Tax=Deinococcus cavernae TaxID=2320857 RepID=A0A418VHR4_9DEIO|nr:DNA primase family protein [Deinococcus cavernae]RJF75668.1 hypothetical protein D3875_01065 [Deinococcus cavernae]
MTDFDPGGSQSTDLVLPPDVAPGTDAANASFLVQGGFGKICRYVPGVGWRRFVPEQGCWDTVKKQDQLLHVVSEKLQPMITEYAATLPRGSRADQEEMLAWWRRVGNTTTLTHTLRFASGLPELILPAKEWDPEHHLLNVENGILNLLDGSLTPHRPDALMTGQARVTYTPGATHPTFEDMRQNLKNQGIEDYLCRAVGRALPGRVEAEEVHLLLGEGGTGKGTLVSALQAMLGSYACTVPIQSLLLNRHGESVNGARPYLSHTLGKRLVVAQEVPKHSTLNAALVKEITGRDVITVRNLYQDAFEFLPQFALWILSNFTIMFDGDDTGLERRLRVVPFTHKPAVERENYKLELQEPLALSALLNWALSGYQKWRGDAENYDYGDTNAVRAATEEQWRATRPVRGFVADTVLGDDTAFLPSHELADKLADWVNRQGLVGKPGTASTNLWHEMQKTGIKRCKVNQVRGWRARWRADD